jgi:O-antigen ligase/tetratricopeptide (TPR) repeat protein
VAVAHWAGALPATRPRLFAIPWLLLAGLLLAAAIAGDHTAHSLTAVRRLAAVAALFLATTQLVRSPAQARTVITAALSATAASSLYALGQYAGLDPFPWAYDPGLLYDGMPGTLGNPNYAAHLLVVMIPLALLTGFGRGRWIAALGLVLLFLAHLAGTGQRAGIVGLGAAAALIGAGLPWRRLRPPAATAATLALFGIAAAATVAGAMVYLNAKTGLPVPLDESLLVRYNGYASTARMIQDRPVLGYGPGAFVIESTPFWTPYEQQRFAAEQEMNAHAHNDLLEFAADAGLGASFLYLFLLVGGLTHALHLAFASPPGLARRFGWCAAAALCAFAIDGLFGFNGRVPASAAVLAVLLGSLDGIVSAQASPPAARRRAAAVPMLAVTIVALIAATGATRHFLADALYSASSQSARRGDAAEAERALQNAARLDRSNWVYRAELGVMLLGRGEHEAAWERFQEALDRNPNYFMALVNMASARLDAAIRRDAEDNASAEDLNAARDYVEHALALCPVLPEALELRGRIRVAEAERAAAVADAAAHYAAAESDFRQALANGAQNAFSLFLRVAEIRTRQGDPEGAERFLARAVEENPGSDRLWAAYHALASETGRFAGMQEALFYSLQAVQDRDPGDATTLATLKKWFGVVKEAVGELPQAERLFQEAIELAPSRVAAWEAYAAYGRRHGREDLVKRHLAKAAAHFHARGAPAPAFEAVHQALNEPGDGPLRGAGILRDGLAYTQDTTISPTELEDLAWAARWVAPALPPPETSFDAALAWCTLGRVHARAGNDAEAVRSFARGMPHAPPGFRVQFAPAWAEAVARLGRPAEAAEILRRALALDPADVPARLALARLLAGQGEASEAQRHYETLMNAPDLPATVRPRVAYELGQLPGGAADG